MVIIRLFEPRKALGCIAETMHPKVFSKENAYFREKTKMEGRSAPPIRGDQASRGASYCKCTPRLFLKVNKAKFLGVHGAPVHFA